VTAHPTRRLVLAAVAALPLATVGGCAGPDVLATPPKPAPDVGVLRSAIAAEQLMVDRYTAALGRSRAAGAAGASAGGGWPPALTAALQPLLAQHQAHLAQLRSRLVVPAGSRDAGLASSRPPASAGGQPLVPAAPGEAVAFLRRAEQAAAAALADGLLRVPGSLAQLFASISASEATHVPVLEAAGQAS
jgi:hypothetical protein